MILSSLVQHDPRGFIDLDKNLARHIGEKNVDAFHQEAGDLVIDEMIDNPKVFNQLMSDEAVVAELGTAIQRISNQANARPLATAGHDHASLSKSLMHMAAGRDSMVMREIIQGEILTNGVINDRAMRNPAIMEILNERVQDLFRRKRAEAGKG